MEKYEIDILRHEVESEEIMELSEHSKKLEIVGGNVIRVIEPDESAIELIEEIRKRPVGKPEPVTP